MMGIGTIFITDVNRLSNVQRLQLSRLMSIERGVFGVLFFYGVLVIS